MGIAGGISRGEAHSRGHTLTTNREWRATTTRIGTSFRVRNDNVCYVCIWAWAGLLGSFRAKYVFING